MVAAGSIFGHCRKLVVIATYLPPNYRVPRGKAALDFLSRVIIQMKRKYKDPFIVLGATSINGRLMKPWRTTSSSRRLP